MKTKSGKLHVFAPDGTVEVTALDVKPTLEQLQKAVGGYIERVRVRVEGRVRDGWVNEDGIAERLQLNVHAMKLLAPPFTPAFNHILGNLAVWVPDKQEQTK